MSKVTVIGAGNVGATCANVLINEGIAHEVVLLDIKEGVSEGKAMDMMQAANILRLDATIKGVTNDYSATADSDVVIITSGIPRKPGMTREELIGVNAGIVKSVTENVLKYSPKAIIVCVSNPMDTMTYLIHKVSGLPKNQIIGMGGALDSARFRYYLSQAMGADYNQLIKALKEAESYDGPAVVIAYAPCVTHGLKCGMHDVQGEMRRAVEAGYWHLYRSDPRKDQPMQLDSKEPSTSFQEFLEGEVRYASLKRSFPEEAERLFELSAEDAQRRYEKYRALADGE